MSIFKKENGTLVEYTNPIANNCIAPVEDGGTSAHAYAEGAFVMVRNILKKLTSAVAIGDTIDNTNSQDTTVATELAEIEGDIEQINSDLSDITNPEYLIGVEEKIGTFNGKDVYRKRYYADNLSVNADLIVDASLTTTYFDTLLEIKGTYRVAGSGTSKYIFSQMPYLSNARIYAQSDNRGLIILNAGYILSQYLIELVYTKAS